MIAPTRTAKEEGEAVMRMSVIWVCRSPFAEVSLNTLVCALMPITFGLGTFINQQSSVNSTPPSSNATWKPEESYNSKQKVLISSQIRFLLSSVEDAIFHCVLKISNSCTLVSSWTMVSEADSTVESSSAYQFQIWKSPGYLSFDILAVC